MKTRFYWLASVIIAMVMVSCAEKDQLAPKNLTKLYNEKAAELCVDKVYTQIDTGYYELNDARQRLVLQKLAHAGVIDYKVERFAWWNKCTDIKNNVLLKVIEVYCEDSLHMDHEQNVYGRGESISFEMEEHFMVNVQIKRKYKSMIVDEIPTPSTVDEAMAFPKYKATAEDLLQNNEVWAELDQPEFPAVPRERKDVKCKPKKEAPKKVVKPAPAPKKVVKEHKEVVKPAKKQRCVTIDPEMTAKYEMAKAMERRATVNILAYELKAEIARNIQTYENEGALAARCEIIVKSANVTPQGHILKNQVIDGIPAKVNVTLTYYKDKGWVIDADEKEEVKTVIDKRGRKSKVTTMVSRFPKAEINPANVIRPEEEIAE